MCISPGQPLDPSLFSQNLDLAIGYEAGYSAKLSLADMDSLFEQRNPTLINSLVDSSEYNAFYSRVIGLRLDATDGCILLVYVIEITPVP